jgi:hypothetical protein
MTGKAVAPVGVTLLVVLLTAVVTWPQALHMTTKVAAHQDPLFSMWRLAWVAHALATAPLDLFDANIFHPARGTLAFSDAMLLEGLVAAPLHWAGVRPVLIYNVLLILGFVGSGCGMYVLARYLTGSGGPALVSAAVFTMAPYRIEHFMHLELQWAMWVPLTFWALHRAVDLSSWRHGVLGGMFFSLQALSCVYYGAFLGLTLVLFVPLLLFLSKGLLAARAVFPLLAGAAVAFMLTIPYAGVYVEVGASVGSRGAEEIARYSARAASFLAGSPSSLIWAWTAAWGGAELNLFPGLTAVLLAMGAAASRTRRWVVLYVSVAVLAVMMAFGSNLWAYRWLLDRVDLLHGLRSPSRFAILACAALAVLAGLGIQSLRMRLSSRGPSQALVVPCAIGLMLVDYANGGMHLTEPDVRPATVYSALGELPPGVVLELPLPKLDALPGADVLYTAWSTSHWRPLVNGYSGYHPPEYLRTVARMENFPDDWSIAQLRSLDVRYIVVHRSLFEREKYNALALRMAASSDLRAWGVFADPIGLADLFILEQSP